MTCLWAAEACQFVTWLLLFFFFMHFKLNRIRWWLCPLPVDVFVFGDLETRIGVSVSVRQK